jgi:hypothetical protein
MNPDQGSRDAAGLSSGAARTAVVARFRAGLDLVQEIHLVDLFRLAGLARVDGTDPVVPEEASHDVASALEDLLIRQVDTVTRLQYANSFGNIL